MSFRRIQLCLTTGVLLVAAHPAPDDPKPDLEKARAWVQDDLTNVLKDPASAQYDWTHQGELKLGPKGWFICGRVNSKNSYGAYEGYTGFITYFTPTTPGHYNTRTKLAAQGLGWGECNQPSLEGAIR